MEALFFSTLSWAVRRLHQAPGCWILSYFCGFWPGSMFFLPFFCLICAADTCAACASTYNTVTHSIGRPCHRTSSNSDLFSPNTAAFSFPAGRTGCWSKGGRKQSVSMTTKSGGFLLSLEHLYKVSRQFRNPPADAEQVCWCRQAGSFWVCVLVTRLGQHLLQIFEPGSREPPTISSCFFYCSFFSVIKIQPLRCAAPFQRHSVPLLSV